jgi:hypothetical protein
MILDLSLDDLLARLENVSNPAFNQYWASCPSHPDPTPSLSITTTEDGDYTTYCFGGCPHQDVVEALQTITDQPITLARTIKSVSQMRGSMTGLQIFVDLFDFGPNDLDPFFLGGLSRHLDVTLDSLRFKWPSSPRTAKIRVAPPGKFQWSGTASLHPPLWPEVEGDLPDEIYLTEGESDCIVFRRAGFCAFALTMGGQQGGRPKYSAQMLKALLSKGVKKLYLAFDDDDVGHQTASMVVKQLQSLNQSGLHGTDIRVLPMAEMMNPFLGEKDARQAWLRLNDTETFSEEILRIKKIIDDKEEGPGRFKIAKDFLKEAIEEQAYLVDQVIVNNGIGWVSGYPKMGKSYVVLDLALSIATGSKFLNTFDVARTGDVLYVSQENSDASTWTRLKKLTKAKSDVPISLWKNGERIPASQSHELVLDLTREFRFDPIQVEELCREILRHNSRTGRSIRLIIIDPLLNSLPAGKFDINTATDFQMKIIDPIRYMMKKTGAGVVVVHHQSKGDNSTMLGSVVSEASFDDKIEFLTKKRGIEEHRAGDPVLVRLAHRDGEDRIIELKLKITDDDYEAVVVEVNADDDRLTSIAKIKISYADRQREAIDKLYPLLPDGEFTYPQFEVKVRETMSIDEMSISFLSNTFEFMRTTSHQIITIRRGVYQRQEILDDDDVS